MNIALAILFVVLLLGAWFLTLLNLPGNWVLVGAAAIYVLLVDPTSYVAMGWQTVIALAVLATLGEVAEFAAGAAGATRAGGSKRGAVLAIIGSIIGGMLGLAVGVPIPIVGPLVGAILLAGAGAFVGAILGESWKGRALEESWQIGEAAFWGRLGGSLAKIAIGGLMVVVACAALVL
ncbi:MAG: DUF456 domain-containing protein [Pirellulales bacterium]|nr:DUF456 domain-containing protein [Pirellulales bacterium]